MTIKMVLKRCAGNLAVLGGVVGASILFGFWFGIYFGGLVK